MDRSGAILQVELRPTIKAAVEVQVEGWSPGSLPSHDFSSWFLWGQVARYAQASYHPHRQPCPSAWPGAVSQRMSVGLGESKVEFRNAARRASGIARDPGEKKRRKKEKSDNAG